MVHLPSVCGPRVREGDDRPLHTAPSKLDLSDCLQCVVRQREREKEKERKKGR